MKITKGLTWPFLLLALASSLVFMAGLAALQNGCRSHGFVPALNGNSSPTSVFGMSDGSGTCSKVFRFYWFSWAFVFVTLLGLAITAITHLGLHFSRPFWIGMLAISTILMMIASEAFLGFDNNYRYGGVNAPTSWIHRWRTALAGAIMSVASLVLLMMAVGTDWERHGHNTHRGRDDKVTTGGPTTTTEHVAVPVGNVRVVDQV